jgi:2-polyprenyl-6-methoxyphenol hydroxylase-like FAD-dependent oxidoreductase
MTRRAIVVGGGIGGLATAIALDQAGWEVDVFERHEQFTEIGAGLTLWPNALSALDALGVGDKVRAAALTGFDGGFMTTSGRWLTRLNTEDLKDHYGEVVVLARPDLLSLLLSAVPERSLHPSTLVEAVTADGMVTTLIGRHAADLIVGADGVRSFVRKRLWPDAAPPRYSGFTAWRFNTGVLDDPVPDGAWVWGSRRSFGYTPLPGGRAYAYAIERTPAGGESTSLDAFANWREPIPKLIANVGDGGVLRHDIYEGPVLDSFVTGSVALVGDSAHAMQPSLGQGACQALEDAITLGRCSDDLARYDRERRGRTQRIVRESRLVMNSAHVSSPILSLMRNASYAVIPQTVNVRLLKPDWAWKPPDHIELTSAS